MKTSIDCIGLLAKGIMRLQQSIDPACIDRENFDINLATLYDLFYNYLTPIHSNAQTIPMIPNNQQMWWSELDDGG